jgi:hypothetical protein
LKTIGKERGYVEKTQIEHEMTGFKTAADMVKALREGMDGTESEPETEAAPVQDATTTIELEGFEWSHLPQNNQDQSS